MANGDWETVSTSDQDFNWNPGTICLLCSTTTYNPRRLQALLSTSGGRNHYKFKYLGHNIESSGLVGEISAGVVPEPLSIIWDYPIPQKRQKTIITVTTNY